MAGENILQEYLIALGWKNDEASQKRFTKALDGVQEQIATLTGAIEAMTAKAVGATKRMAATFEDLYWSSQRTGASVTNIKAFSYAISQMGGSADGAHASIERFAERLRSSPGYFGMLRTLGIKTHEANGAMRDTVDVVRDLGRVLASKPYHVAKTYAENLGIDEDTLRAIIRGVDRFADDYKAKLRKAGLTPDEAARDANALQTIWRDLWSTVEIIIAKVTSKIVKELGGDISKFSDWLLQNSSKIADAFAEIVRLVMDLTKAVVDLLGDGKELGKFFGDMADGARKFAQEVRDLVKPLRDLFEWIEEKRRAGDEFGARGGIFGWLRRKLGMQGEGETYGPNDAQEGIWSKLWRNRPKWMGGTGGGASLNDAAIRGKTARGSLRTNQTIAYKTAIEEGFSPEMARAIAGNLSGEALGKPGDYHWDEKHMASGIAQWDPQRSAKIKAKFGAMPHQLDVATQVKAHLWELRKDYPGLYADMKAGRLSGAQAIARLVNEYERPAQRLRASTTALRIGFMKGVKAPEAAAPAPAAPTSPKAAEAPPSYPERWLDPNGYKRSVTGAAAPATNSWSNSQTVLNQSNQITVSGVSDPTAAARETERGLGRVNAGLLRNLEGPAQ